MNDQQLLRYSRQIMLGQVDIAGQERLLASRALIIGLGGLGSPAALYLAAAGVGTLVLADFDRVEMSNLQRQIAHAESRLGASKVDSACAAIAELNSEVAVECIDAALEGEALLAEVARADVVLDCSDNFSTRFAVNRACVETGTPLVSGAAIRLEGQLAVFDPRRADSPCYACLYDEAADENLTCSESGVLAPLVGVIGSMQALEATKLLAGVPLDSGKLLLLDGASLDWRQIRLRRDPACAVCTTSSGR